MTADLVRSKQRHMKAQKHNMAKPFSSLALRLISSAILIPVVVGIIIWGELAFKILISICLFIALLEWMKITKNIPSTAIAKIIIGVIGIFYMGASFMEITLLRNMLDGAYWTILFMATIWASDSGAYLFGKTIGGPKMSPTISPNKTWSGYIGALLFPAIILILADFSFQGGMTTLQSGLAGIAIGITGQAGDLMISAMKRKAGLKDTGSIIPGHGGILDRIDALLLALPIYLAYVKYISE